MKSIKDLTMLVYKSQKKLDEARGELLETEKENLQFAQPQYPDYDELENVVRNQNGIVVMRDALKAAEQQTLAYKNELLEVLKAAGLPSDHKIWVPYGNGMSIQVHYNINGELVVGKPLN